MRIFCPARTAHPRTVALLRQFTPGATLSYMADDESYWRLVQGLWGGSKAFMLVEHDVGVHGRVVSQFESCPHPWCVFPYSGPVPADGTGPGVIDRGFGCVRFSAALLAATRGLLDELPRHWRGLADVVADELEARGYERHVHQPPVGHYHYERVWPS